MRKRHRHLFIHSRSFKIGYSFLKFMFIPVTDHSGIQWRLHQKLQVNLMGAGIAGIVSVFELTSSTFKFSNQQLF
jgi:hypothetical protein